MLCYAVSVPWLVTYILYIWWGGIDDDDDDDDECEEEAKITKNKKNKNKNNRILLFLFYFYYFYYLVYLELSSPAINGIFPSAPHKMAAILNYTTVCSKIHPYAELYFAILESTWLLISLHGATVVIKLHRLVVSTRTIPLISTIPFGGSVGSRCNKKVRTADLWRWQRLKCEMAVVAVGCWGVFKFHGIVNIFSYYVFHVNVHRHGMAMAPVLIIILIKIMVTVMGTVSWHVKSIEPPPSIAIKRFVHYLWYYDDTKIAVNNARTTPHLPK